MAFVLLLTTQIRRNSAIALPKESGELQNAASTDTRAMQRLLMIWLMIMIGFGISLSLLYPGHYSFDSAYQYWQARTGKFSNVTPVPMIGLWSVLLDVFGNPASLLCLNLGLFWAGLGLCFASRTMPLALAATGIAVCGLSPLVLMQMGHLLSDAHVAALLVLATGLFATCRVGDSGYKVCFAFLLIVYAGCIRQNALAAVVPFGAVAASIMFPPPRLRILLAGAVVTALITLAVSTAFDRTLAVERRPLWPMLAIWDLAAMSVASNQLLLPAFTHGPGLDVEELRETRAFDPVSAAPLFARSRSGMKSGLEGAFSVEQQRELAASWLSALRDHPSAYLGHRMRTSALLFGRHGSETSGLAYYPTQTSYRDNPELPARWNPSAHQYLVDLADRLVSTWFFSALPYLLIHLTIWVLAARRRQHPHATIVLGVTSSALLYSASFVILAPSAELRFLTWPIIAAPLVAMLWFAAPRNLATIASATHRE